MSAEVPARSIPKRRKILVEVSDESKCLLDHRYQTDGHMLIQTFIRKKIRTKKD